MKCPFCGALTTSVVESRTAEDGESIRRRRLCEKCDKRFTTYERSRQSLWVVKKDGRRERFDREKLRSGLLKAIEKRPISIELIDEVTDEIEREMLRRESEEVSSRLIGNAVLRRLKKIDKVAWLRFASVYLQFEDLEDFERAMDEADKK